MIHNNLFTFMKNRLEEKCYELNRRTEYRENTVGMQFTKLLRAQTPSTLIIEGDIRKKVGGFSPPDLAAPPVYTVARERVRAVPRKAVTAL